VIESFGLEDVTELGGRLRLGTLACPSGKDAVDDSESRQIMQALRESEARLHAVLSSLDDLVFELDESCTYLGVWTSNDDLLVAPRSELLGRTPAEVMGEDMGLKLKQITNAVLETGNPEVWEYCLEVPAGVRWFQCRVSPIAESGGSPRRICLLVRDITAQKQAEHEISRLLSREQLLSRLSEALPVGLFEIDTAGHITFTNDLMHTISGQLVADSVEALMAAVVAEDIPVLSSALEQVFADEAVDGLEIRFRLAPVAASPRAERVCDLSLRALTNEFGVVTGAVGCLSDVTDRIQLRRELEIRASVDKLTSCLNRDAALELLGRTTRAAAGLGDGNALVFVDVDRLKSVNDQLGHGAGDRLLDAVGDRLRHAARRGDAVGRVGGDEFIVICPRVAGPAQAVVIAERIAAATTANIDVGDDVVEMRTSVGVSWTNEALDADTFLAQADAAMYQSKRTSDKRVTLFAANP
jgi:diguanylate cyclase (GGDEF)-like protein/PAS domain S-box-containing protein